MNLVEIDLSKAYKNEHPDIKTDGSLYLVKVHDNWITGKFHREWYGLCFTWFWSIPAGRQFDAPNYNNSSWEKVFEIVNI